MHIQHQDVDQSASPAPNAGGTGTRLPRAAICWQSLRGSPCKRGSDCKFHHLSDEELKLLENALEMHGPANSERPSPQCPQGNAAQLEAETKFAREQESQLRLRLRKTKLCYRYLKGQCPRGPMCHFVHMQGPEAHKFLSFANSVRQCPHELVYSFCANHSSCVFFHKLPQGGLGSPETSTTDNELSRSDSSISASVDGRASVLQTGGMKKEETRKEGQEGSTLLHFVRDEDCSESSRAPSTKSCF